MVLIDLTSVDLSDLPIDAFKAHLRLGTGFSDDAIQDDVLEGYIRAAMAAIEARIGKMLLTRRATWELTEWSDASAQPLPVAPISAVASITLVTRDGVEEIVDPDDYVLKRDRHRPQILPEKACLPRIPRNGTAQIVFEAGFGPGWLDIPPDLREAVYLLAAHYYENRQERAGSNGLLPFGVMALLDAHRNIRIFGSPA